MSATTRCDRRFKLDVEARTFVNTLPYHPTVFIALIPLRKGPGKRRRLGGVAEKAGAEGPHQVREEARGQQADTLGGLPCRRKERHTWPASLRGRDHDWHPLRMTVPVDEIEQALELLTKTLSRKSAISTPIYPLP